MENKQQTAVEWLIEQINTDCLNSYFITPDMAKAALQMEKNQIIDAHEQAYMDMNLCFRGFDRSEDYYRNTYADPQAMYNPRKK